MAKRQTTVEEWTYERLLELPEEDYPRRYEIIDGVSHELPTPSMRHAGAKTRIAYTIHVTVRARGGQAFIAPVDVLLSSRARPVQPDVIVLLPEHLDQMRDAFVEGPPDIVVEVLSPNDPKRDRVLKREVYAAGGVPEYWLVSPEAGTVEVLVLDGGAYRTHVRAGGDETVSSIVLPELSFPASAVFE